MSKKPVTNTAASVRQRLLNLAKSRHEDYNAILLQYGIERFLFRLSQSPHGDQLVLKGAMLFRVWVADLHRPTLDVDFLGVGDPSPLATAELMRRIISIEVANDGIEFNAESVTATEIREGQKYGGIRVRLEAALGTARIPIQLDVGFGDVVVPDAAKRLFPTLLDHDAPQLKMYPPETVVAEKLQALTVLGIANSRMKDFFDLWIIARQFRFDGVTLTKAIRATFDRRETPIPAEMPFGLTDAFGDDRQKQQQWRAFRKRLQLNDAPDELKAVIDHVRVFVALPLACALTGEPSKSHWLPGGPWGTPPSPRS